MGIIRTMESLKAEMEEIKTMITQTIQRKPGEDLVASQAIESREKVVCVTSGVSYLGLSVAGELLLRGYHVRLGVENEEHVEKLGEMEAFASVRHRVQVVMAKVMEVESLCEAFNGCHGVFHTSAFDAGGISGYTKHLAELEAKAGENVIEACSRTSSVRKCVFTSSLLACIWRPTVSSFSPAIDESCWSQESFCREKKEMKYSRLNCIGISLVQGDVQFAIRLKRRCPSALWLALGKTIAEKSAWMKAREMNVNLVTICPALITGPGFYDRNSTASIAYLKGAHEMFASGLLATVNVAKVAKAHVAAYEEMSRGAAGRYICFDKVIRATEDAVELQQQMKIAGRMIQFTQDALPLYDLRNTKLRKLMSVYRQCTHTTYL
ncbi:cinnamoyl-CoA reductase-like SNL6 isoform X1 [Nymphaea colorata]|uniref:cinnamoyl-CoA reductase-like SNL6 isoform X1 n=1 Tax=Nymphaea colorata TaxID=210225 RepID=UPI00129D98F3|nr:cinnamoyl-CoA reductase-like SNL6 isoform X1 [Nymphaea colorata]XP_031494799.1 cinnamoyl-CoA reductase-like SNL6 isoform X1 [Nymphaea colorata]XP_031494800.1 cinnamoyl-CoA reductase-like SNL6 isoform X1 [Nymphaea colorata]XP_049935550.1 cinnamoyl-CoA reductase-like SNL6 isoform X1 [Nymphaea colorata]